MILTCVLRRPQRGGERGEGFTWAAEASSNAKEGRSRKADPCFSHSAQTWAPVARGLAKCLGPHPYPSSHSISERLCKQLPVSHLSEPQPSAPVPTGIPSSEHRMLQVPTLMSLASPKSPTLQTLFSPTRMFLAATSRWM